MQKTGFRLKASAVAFSVGLLGGCAEFSVDGGFGTAQDAAQERLGKQAKWTRSAMEVESARVVVADLLAKPLSVDDAEQLALLNNPGLQATYAELGIAEADLVQAGRMTNPHFAYLRTSDGEESKIEWSLAFPVIDLLTMPLRKRMEQHRFDEVRLAVAAATIAVALDTRRAWYAAVAADQAVRYMEQAKTSAEAGAELAQRMARAGNFPKLAQMREQVFYAEVLARLARAKQTALSQRERLTSLAGLQGKEISFKLPERLPDLPAAAQDVRDLEATAMAQRYDIQAAKQASAALAQSLGLTRTTRLINALELGPARTREDPTPWKRGYEVSLEVPLFDWGSARVAKAEAIYMQSVHRLAELGIAAQSEVRESYAATRTAYDIAERYRDQIVPLRKAISEEDLQRYNGMLISVFELLADAREQVASVNASIEAQRDFWLAQTDLQSALNGAGRRPRAEAVPEATRAIARTPALAGH